MSFGFCFRVKEMVAFERYEKRDDLSFGFCFWGKKRYEKRDFHLYLSCFVLFCVFATLSRHYLLKT